MIQRHNLNYQNNNRMASIGEIFLSNFSEGDAYILPRSKNKGNHTLFQFFKAG